MCPNPEQAKHLHTNYGVLHCPFRFSDLLHLVLYHLKQSVLSKGQFEPSSLHQVTLPEPDYKDLDDCLRAACKAANLQATPVFMEKAHQLYEMVLVRHGLMVVGYSFAAKASTACWLLLWEICTTRS